MILRRSHMDSVFILFAGDEATVARLIHAGLTSGLGDLRLHCRRWTRQAFAEGAHLPSLVNMVFRGVPAHAWEMATAESLVSPYGWPQVLHSSTRNRDDCSAFRVTAWCFNPSDVPRGRNLHVVEPPVRDILSPHGKPTLVYPVSIVVSTALLPEPSGESGGDSGSSGDGDDGGRRHRRRLGTQESAVRVAVPKASEPSGSAPVRGWLVPSASRACREACVVEADRSPSRRQTLEPSRIDAASAEVSVELAAAPTPDTLLDAAWDVSPVGLLRRRQATLWAWPRPSSLAFRLHPWPLRSPRRCLLPWFLQPW